MQSGRQERYSVVGCTENLVEPRQSTRHFHCALQRFLVNDTLFNTTKTAPSVLGLQRQSE